MNIKTLLFLIFISSSITSSYSQIKFGKVEIEDIKDLSNKTLIVFLRGINPKIVTYLKKNKEEENLETYLSEIESYNSAIKSQFTAENWTYSKEIKFIKESELKEYDKKSNKDKYVLFYNNYQKSKQKFTMINIIGNKTNYKYRIKSPGKKNTIYDIFYSTSYTSKADIKFIIQQTKKKFKECISKEGKKKLKRKEQKTLLAESSKQLKTKILLIDKNDINKILLKKIDKLYKYPYKITTREEIDEAILKEKNDVLFLRIVPIREEIYEQDKQLTNEDEKYIAKYLYSKHIYNPENGDIVSTTSISISMGNIGVEINATGETITEIEFKKIIKLIKQ